MSGKYKYFKTDKDKKNTENENTENDLTVFKYGSARQKYPLLWYIPRSSTPNQKNHKKKMHNKPKPTKKEIKAKGILKHDNKKSLKKIFIRSAAAVTILGVLVLSIMIPSSQQKAIKKKIDLISEDHPPVEMINEAPVNNSGIIIDNPDIAEELETAYNFLDEKLIGDASLFEMDLQQVDQIKGIYQIDLADKSLSKDVAIQMIVNSNGKDFIFEYTAKGEDFENGFTIDTSTNKTNSILSLAVNLSNCYPSNIIEQDEQKLDLAQKAKSVLGENLLIGDPVIYAENAILNSYIIPIYNENSHFLFSISESTLTENFADINSELIMNLLGEYFEGKNELFKKTSAINQLDTFEDFKDSSETDLE